MGAGTVVANPIPHGVKRGCPGPACSSPKAAPRPPLKLKFVPFAIHYRLTRQEDFHYFAQYTTGPCRFYGLTALYGPLVIGMGGVVKTLDDGRHWAWVIRRPEFAAELGKSLHRNALRLFQGLHRNG